MLHARSMFNLSIGVNMLEDHFVSEVIAFVDHLSRRTTIMELITMGDNIQYRPYDI